MVKGLFRLSMLSIIIVWLVVSVIQWRELSKDLWLIEQHISPYLSDNLLPDLGWPTYAATNEFLALSLVERYRATERYYQLNIEPLEDIYYVAGLIRKGDIYVLYS